ncbi:MAG TPA: hypothetical protein DEB40_14620 [Elusimicrobia bacterium]|nr:hypothetical protein [Elusimicrobiota bacterium]HBT62968.1 hypothetical protein [Elusimicrobiota bacterium]
MTLLSWTLAIGGLIGQSSWGAESVSKRIEARQFGSYIAGGLGLYASSGIWTSDAALAADSGIGTVRFNSDVWDLLEPSPGRFNWAPLDSAVKAARGRGLEILFTIPISSRWNSRARAKRVHGFEVGPTHFPTEDPARLSAFCEALASRYEGRIGYYEVWNEPDFFMFWKGKPDASEYLPILRAAHAGIKKGNPKALVLLGGLAKPEDPAWLTSLLSQDAGQLFDIMNIHVYPAFSKLDKALSSVRGVLARFSLSKPVWITETSSTGLYFETADRDAEEQAKAAYLLKTYAVALSQADMERVFWHTLRNPGRDVGLPRDMDFGLMTSAGEPLPAHRAFARLSRALTGSLAKGKFDAGPGIEAWRFEKPGKTTLILWSRKDKSVFRVPRSYSRARRVSLYGAASELELQGGREIEASEEPFYLELLP